MQACPSSTQEHKDRTSGQYQREQQTARPIVEPSAVLQFAPTNSDLPARSSDHVTDAVKGAGLQSTAGQLLVSAARCKTLPVAPDDAKHHRSHESAVPSHMSSPAATSSLRNHQLSERSQASVFGKKEWSLIPHAELIGEFRIPDFVTAQEQTDIVRMLDAAEPQWKDSTFNGKHRYHQAGTSSCA